MINSNFKGILIGTLMLPTAFFGSSFFLNKATLIDRTFNSDEIVGNYTAVATIKYKATEIADGDVKDIVTVDSDFTIVVSKKGALYELVIDDNDPKTPTKPRYLKTTGFKTNETGTGFQIPKQQFDPDSAKPITIVGIKTYKHNAEWVAGKYSKKTNKLTFKFGGNFYKSLDGSEAAIVSMPTEIEFVATKK